MCLKLLSGAISSAQLEADLSDPLYLGPWRELMKSTELSALLNNATALNAIFGSPTAFSGLLDRAGHVLAASDVSTEIISNNSNAILTVVSNADYLNYWNSVPANKARLQSRVNAVGSKIKRVQYTSSGTWVLPVEGILALGFFGVGAGSSGGTGGVGGSGYGGGGGEAKWGFITESLPVSNVAVTVASNQNSSFGSFFVADKSNSSQTGGGSDSGDSIYETSWSDSIFQIKTGSKKGGNGGAMQSSNAQSGYSGSPGFSGSGGSGGTYSSGYSYGGNPGTGIGSGGGSGAAGGAYGQYAGNPASIPNYGSGGGGGAGNGTSTAGGAGCSGVLVINYILGDAE